VVFIFTKYPKDFRVGFAITAGEAVADVFTLGLAEVIFTPAQAATEDDKHTVVFCYSPDNKLASVNQSENPSGE
jgi:hypothetical protein